MIFFAAGIFYYRDDGDMKENSLNRTVVAIIALIELRHLFDVDK